MYVYVENGRGQGTVDTLPPLAPHAFLLYCHFFLRLKRTFIFQRKIIANLLA